MQGTEHCNLRDDARDDMRKDVDKLLQDASNDAYEVCHRDRDGLANAVAKNEKVAEAWLDGWTALTVGSSLSKEGYSYLSSQIRRHYGQALAMCFDDASSHGPSAVLVSLDGLNDDDLTGAFEQLRYLSSGDLAKEAKRATASEVAP